VSLESPIVSPKVREHLDEYWPYYAIFSFIGAALLVCVLMIIHESNQLDEFARVHHCKVVSQSIGTVAPTFGISTSGQPVSGTTYVPGQIGYLCDDGVVYYW
jgi:hypothetical protein